MARLAKYVKYIYIYSPKDMLEIIVVNSRGAELKK